MMFKEDIEEVGDICRVRVFTANGNEFCHPAPTLDEARAKAESFKRGYRNGAKAAADAALQVAT